MDSRPDGVHCPTCNIDYELDFSTNVELAFSPGTAVRSVESDLFCRSSPMTTPHIKCVVSVEPDEQVEISLDLTPGVYRARTLESDTPVEFELSAGEAIELRFDGSAVDVTMSAGSQHRLVNNCRRTGTAVIEELEWRRDCLTAARVTTLQGFRDLFSTDVLRPGDEVTIKSVSFMFSDLAGSTALFSQVGDAHAYSIIREHFALLSTEVREANGSIVKTLGDGMLAAFHQPEDAFKAAVAIHRTVGAAFALSDIDVAYVLVYTPGRVSR